MPTKWMSISPIENYRWKSKVPLPIYFELGVRIDSIPIWVYKTSKKITLSLHDTQRLQNSQFAFVAEYEAESLGAPDPNDSSPENKRDIQSSTYLAIYLANLAIWVTNPNGVSPFVHFDMDNIDSEPRIRKYSPFNGLNPLVGYQNRILLNEDFVKAKLLHKQLLSLDRKGTIWRAIYALGLGLRELDWASRFMQMWIVFEALFGPKDAREVTYRLSQRIAFFTSNNKLEASDLFQEIKTSYSWRSKVVHGLRLNKLEEDESEYLSYITEQLVATTLSKILSDSKLIEVFDGASREEYLEHLIFIS